MACPWSPRPYAAIGDRLGIGEAEVIAGLRRLIDDGVIKRFGVIVRHRALGYRANAMVVWDVPDARVGAAGPTCWPSCRSSRSAIVARAGCRSGPTTCSA